MTTVNSYASCPWWWADPHGWIPLYAFNFNDQICGGFQCKFEAHITHDSHPPYAVEKILFGKSAVQPCSYDLLNPKKECKTTWEDAYKTSNMMSLLQISNQRHRTTLMRGGPHHDRMSLLHMMRVMDDVEGKSKMTEYFFATQNCA